MLESIIKADEDETGGWDCGKELGGSPKGMRWVGQGKVRFSTGEYGRQTG